MFQRLIALSLLTISWISHAEPLFWTAEKDSRTFMIVGSVHVGNESMFPLPSPIMDFLSTSDGLILEADTRKSNDIVYPASTLTSKDVLNRAQLSELNSIASQLDLDEKTLLNSPPWISALGIQMAQFKAFGYQAGLGVDLHLLYKATFKDLPVIPLESLQYQIDLLAGLPRDGEELLVSALDEIDTAENTAFCLIETWKKGDLASLSELIEVGAMSDELEQRLMIDRNEDWSKKLASTDFLPNKDGRYLVVVGALHLVGENNLLELLNTKGYQITQISKSEKVNCNFE